MFIFSISQQHIILVVRQIFESFLKFQLTINVENQEWLFLFISNVEDEG